MQKAAQFGITAALIVTCLLAPEGCATQTQPVLAHFDSDLISFDYPARWNEALPSYAGVTSSPVVFLSTDQLVDTCQRTSVGTRCGGRFSVDHLGADGAVAEWWWGAAFGYRFDPTRGTLITVGGRHATFEDVDATDECRTIGGLRSISVAISSAAAIRMSACVAGPSPDIPAGQINAILASVKLTEQPASTPP
jgi:hypothetical protein